MDVSAFLTEDALLKILQIVELILGRSTIVLGAISFPLFHIWKKTELHIPASTYW
jgi:hypothetical protein